MNEERGLRGDLQMQAVEFMMSVSREPKAKSGTANAS
jgi:hypothetical protein